MSTASSESEKNSISPHVINSVSMEKGFDPEIIFTAVEEALSVVIAKQFPEDAVVGVRIDRETGAYQAFRHWAIVEDSALESSEQEIALSKARQYDETLVVGDTIEEPITVENLGRVAAHQAKHIITGIVRDAERVKITNQLKKHVNELIPGVVKRVARDAIILDLGDNAEALLPKDALLPRETVRVNDRLRCYVCSVRPEQKGPHILVSRVVPEMLIALFKLEVPEIAEGIIEIKAAARDPGSRAKIAVKTNDGRIDPIGACVGMRGTRVQAISGELGGERVDIILWDDDPVQMVINAMVPAEVSSIVVDEEEHSMDVAVNEEQLAQAIGHRGQNVRLASQLTGWALNVMTADQIMAAEKGESASVLSKFVDQLDVDEEVAEVLVHAGFTSIKELVKEEKREALKAIEEFDDDIIAALIERAGEVLLTQAISDRDRTQPASNLLDLQGMDEVLAQKLADNGIITCEQLAECSVDEIVDFPNLDLDRDRERIAALIMLARAPWFEQQGEGD